MPFTKLHFGKSLRIYCLNLIFIYFARYTCYIFKAKEAGADTLCTKEWKDGYFMKIIGNIRRSKSWKNTIRKICKRFCCIVRLWVWFMFGSLPAVIRLLSTLMRNSSHNQEKKSVKKVCLPMDQMLQQLKQYKRTPQTQSRNKTH